MTVTLREIDKNNFLECTKLKVADGQEKFVATNLMSLAQAKIYYPDANPLAIYADDEMVGFVMYVYVEEDERLYLGRLMIDEKHQGKGYGRAATLEVIERVKKSGYDALFLSFVPENTGAEKLYSSIGFEKTGEIDEGEILMRFDLNKSANNGEPAAYN